MTSKVTTSKEQCCWVSVVLQPTSSSGVGWLQRSWLKNFWPDNVSYERTLFPKAISHNEIIVFNSLSDKEGEFVPTFVADLQRLSEYCEFEFGDSLVEMLCDRLICGINNDCMQHRLLAESKLSFEKTCELAQAMETADHDARELQGPPTTAVHKLNRGTGRSFSTGPRPKFHNNLQNNCYRCGGKHFTNDCRFCLSECRFCKKVCHIERACRSKDQRTKGNASSQTHNLSFSSAIQPITVGQMLSV